MKVSVNESICTGCESCVGTCPMVFKMGLDGAQVIVDEVPFEFKGLVHQAANDCPDRAIIVE